MSPQNAFDPTQYGSTRRQQASNTLPADSTPARFDPKQFGSKRMVLDPTSARAKQAQEYEAPFTEKALGQASDFVKQVGGDTLGVFPAMYDFYKSGLSFPKLLAGLAEVQIDQFGKAVEQGRKGEYAGAAGYTMAGLIPLLGPGAAEAGEMIERGEYGKALGRILTLLSPVALNR